MRSGGISPQRTAKMHQQSTRVDADCGATQPPALEFWVGQQHNNQAYRQWLAGEPPSVASSRRCATRTSMTPRLSASPCKARRIARSTGSSLAKCHSASRSTAEVTNGATKLQSSSWSRRLRPNAPASVAVFWRAEIVGVSSTNHSAARKARIWSCRNSCSGPIGRKMRRPALSSDWRANAKNPSGRLARSYAAAASPSSMRAAPTLQVGGVARRVRWRAPTSPVRAWRDRHRREASRPRKYLHSRRFNRFYRSGP